MHGLNSEKKDWQEVQASSFTRWANSYLSQRGLMIRDLSKDFTDGTLLINLLEILSDKKLPRYNKNPRLGVQRIANLNIALDFMKESGLKMVNIGPEDIEKGNVKIILGLMWTTILRFQIQKFNSADGKDDQVAGAFGMEFETPQTLHTEDSSKAMLLRFVNDQIASYNVGEIRNFTSAFTDGRVLMALCDSMAPGTVDMSSLSDPLTNVSVAIGTAEREFGIPVLLDASDVVLNPNEQSMMAYVSFFQNFKVTHQFHVKKKQVDASNSSLTTAVVMQHPGTVAVETKQNNSQQNAVVHNFSPELFLPISVASSASLSGSEALLDSSAMYKPQALQPWMSEFAAEEIKEPVVSVAGYGYDDAEMRQEEKIAQAVQKEFMQGLQIADVIGYQLAIQDLKKKRYELSVGCTGLTKMGYVGRSNPMVGLFEKDPHGNHLLVDFTEWLTDDHDPVFSKSFVVRFNNDASDKNKSYRMVVWHVSSRDIEDAARIHQSPKVSDKNVIGYADFLLSSVIAKDSVGEILKLPLDASTAKQDKKLKDKNATVSVTLRKTGLRIARMNVPQNGSRKGNRIEVRVTVFGQRYRNPMVAIFEKVRGARMGESLLLGHTEWIRLPTNEQTFSRSIVLYETGKDNASRWLKVCLYNVNVPTKEEIRSTQGQLVVTSSENDLVGTRDITMQELLVALQQGEGLTYPFFGAGRHAGKGSFTLRGRLFDEVKEVRLVGVSNRITNTYVGHEVEISIKCTNLFSLDMHSPCNPVVALFEKDQQGDYHLEGQTEWLKSEFNPVFTTKFHIYNVLSDQREYRLNVYDVDVDAFADLDPGHPGSKMPIVTAMDGNLCSERALVGVGFVKLQAMLLQAALGQPITVQLQAPVERRGKPDSAFPQRSRILAEKKCSVIVGIRIYHAVCAETIQKQTVQQDFRQLGSVPQILYLASKPVDQTGHEVRLSFSASRLPKFDWWSRGNPFVVLLEKCAVVQSKSAEQNKAPVWDCPACTFQNPATYLACEMCAMQRPTQFNSLASAVGSANKEANKTEWKVLAQTEWVPNTPDPVFKRQLVVCYDHDSDKELRIAVYDASSNKPPTFDALVGFANIRLSKIVEMADGLPFVMDLSSERPGVADLIRSKHSSISVSATLDLVNDDRRRVLPKPGTFVKIAHVRPPAAEGKVDKELLVTLGGQYLLKLFWPARAPMMALLKESTPNNFDVLLQQTEWFECMHSACVFQTALRIPLDRDLSKRYRFALFDVGSEVIALRDMIGFVDITLQQLAEEAIPFKEQFVNMDDPAQKIPKWQFRMPLQSENPQLDEMLKRKGACLNFLVQQRARVSQQAANANILSLLGFD